MPRPQVNISLASPEGERTLDAIRSYAGRLQITESSAAGRLLRLGVAAAESAGFPRASDDFASVNVLLGALSDELEKIEGRDPCAALGLAVGCATALVRYSTQRGLAYGLDDDGVMRPAIETTSAALADVAVSNPGRAQECARQLATGVGAWAGKADTLAAS